MQKDSIEVLHQYRDPLIQEACLSSLAVVQRNPPSKVIEEVASWCVEYAQGLYRNWFKDVAGTEVNVLHHLARSCRLCCCTCLMSGIIIIIIIIIIILINLILLKTVALEYLVYPTLTDFSY